MHGCAAIKRIDEYRYQVAQASLRPSFEKGGVAIIHFSSFSKGEFASLPHPAARLDVAWPAAVCVWAMWGTVVLVYWQPTVVVGTVRARRLARRCVVHEEKTKKSEKA